MVASIISLISGTVLWLPFYFAWKICEQNRRTTLTKTFEVNACWGILIFFVYSWLVKEKFFRYRERVSFQTKEKSFIHFSKLVSVNSICSTQSKSGYVNFITHISQSSMQGREKTK